MRRASTLVKQSHRTLYRKGLTLNDAVAADG